MLPQQHKTGCCSSKKCFSQQMAASQTEMPIFVFFSSIWQTSAKRSDQWTHSGWFKKADTVAVMLLAIISILPSTSLFLPLLHSYSAQMLQADSGLLFLSLLRDALRNLFGVVMLPNMLLLCCWCREKTFFSVNGNLSVNKLFQCELSNVGHLGISGDECHRNNHSPVCLCVCACVSGCLCSLHVRLWVNIRVYEWVDVFEREQQRDREKERQRSHLYAILWLSAFEHVGRQRRLGGMKSWEVQLKANEAEQTLLWGKQFSMTEMAQAQARVLRYCCAGEPRGVWQGANRLVNNL